MAPLPSNNTALIFLDYSTCGVEHTVQCRYGPTSSASDAMILLHDLLTVLDPGLTLLTVLGARFRAEGSNITLPLVWTGDSNYGGTLGPRYKGAAFLDFVGRDVEGRRCRLEIFGPGDFFDTTNEDYRFTSTDSAVVADAVAVLQAGSGTPVSIAGNDVGWYPYANTGVNAYWRNRIR